MSYYFNLHHLNVTPLKKIKKSSCSTHSISTFAWHFPFSHMLHSPSTSAILLSTPFSPYAWPTSFYTHAWPTPSLPMLNPPTFSSIQNWPLSPPMLYQSPSLPMLDAPPFPQFSFNQPISRTMLNPSPIPILPYAWHSPYSIYDRPNLSPSPYDRPNPFPLW